MDWQAKWIWSEPLLDTRNCYVYARREFEIDSASSAQVCVTCSSAYKLYANGRYIGRGPGPCDPSFQYYDTYDLSHVLRPGKNVIGAICYNHGVSLPCRPNVPGGFLLQMAIRRNGGEPEIIGTDEDWRVLPAADWDFGSSRMSDDSGFQEVYDSRRKPVGWNVVGFDDASWERAFVVGPVGCDPWTSLIERQIPPLAELELHPKQVLKCGTVSSIDDAAIDVATRVYAEPISETSGAVSYAKEMLRQSGDAAVVNPGSDAFVVLDYGSEVVGFPVLKIRGAGTAIVDVAYSEALDDCGRVCPTRNGVLQADRLILHGGRQEWQTFGRRAFRYLQLTFRQVAAPVLVESVHVSRVGYPVELVSTFECSDDLLNSIWRTGVYTLTTCMQDTYECSALGQMVGSDGVRVQALANYYCFFDAALAAKTIDEMSRRSGAGSSWVMMLYDHYLHTGDLGLITQLYPRVRSAVDADIDTADHATVRAAEKLAAAVSVSEDALRWHQRAGELRAVSDAPLAECSDPRTGFHALQTLATENRTHEALDMIRSKWGQMLHLGATAFWEQFSSNGAVPSGSLCCGSSCAPVHFLPAEIVGVKPASPGGPVVIQPRVGDLQWARADMTTAAGRASVEWHSEPGLFTMEIDAPEGFITALPVDGFADPVVDEIDLTPETPERRARKTYGWGSTIWRDGQERDPYLDWLASQEAQPPSSYLRRDRCSGGGSYVWVRESVSNHVRYEIREG